MATVLSASRTCDQCRNGSGEEREGRPYVFTAAGPGGTVAYEVDLCDEDYAIHVAPFQRFLVGVGVPIVYIKRKRKGQQREVPQWVRSLRAQCLLNQPGTTTVCGLSVPLDNRLTHLGRHHGPAGYTYAGEGKWLITGLPEGAKVATCGRCGLPMGHPESLRLHSFRCPRKPVGEGG